MFFIVLLNAYFLREILNKNRCKEMFFFKKNYLIFGSLHYESHYIVKYLRSVVQQCCRFILPQYFYFESELSLTEIYIIKKS